MAKMTVREILDRVEYKYDIMVFIRIGNTCKMYDGESEIKTIPEEILNRVATKRAINKLKFVTHVQIWC